MNEITITKDNFEKEVLKSDIPVVVDFWATWCGPCRMLAPVLSELAEEFQGKVKVGKINVDEEQELSMSFNVASIPMILLFENGSVTKTAIGFRTKEQLKEVLGL